MAPFLSCAATCELALYKYLLIIIIIIIIIITGHISEGGHFLHLINMISSVNAAIF